MIVGYGRVGSVIGDGLRERGQRFVVIEENQDIIESLEAEGVSVVPGPRRPVDLMAQARIKEATSVFVALPISFEAGQYVEVARAANPEIFIVARAHSDAEVDYLQRMGANVTIMGEREIGRAMVEHALTQRKTARPA